MKKILIILFTLFTTSLFAQQLELPNPVKVVNPRSLDGKYLYNGNRPYTDTAEVNATIPLGIRHKGLIVNVNNSLWWYKDSVLNNSLVRLILGGGVTKTYADYGLQNVNDSTLQADTVLIATVARLINDSAILANRINGRATFGDVRDIVADSNVVIRQQLHDSTAMLLEHIATKEPEISAPYEALKYWNGYKNFVPLNKDSVGLSNVPNVDATNADNISTGTLSNSRLSSLVARIDNNQFITGIKTVDTIMKFRANGLATTQNYNKGILLVNETAATSEVPEQITPALVFTGQMWGFTTNPFGLGSTNQSVSAHWKVEQRSVSGESSAWNNRLVFSRKEHNGSWIDVGEFNKDGFVGNLSGNSLTLGNIGNAGTLNVRRSSDGSVFGTFKGESGGASIRSGNSVIYMYNIGGSGRISFGNGNPNDGMRYEGSSGLYITKVGTANASPNATLVVDGNVTIGENVAAPTNGLRVVGNTLLQAKTFLGGTTTPTALLHLDKNRSTAGNAAMKFTLDGAALLATPERGALEAMPYRLHYTDSGNQRNTLAYLSDVYKTPMNVADSNYTVVGNEIIIGFTGLTADRACTLPNPASHVGKSLTLFAKGMNDYDLNFMSSYKPKNLDDAIITSVKGDLPKHGVDTGSAIEGFSMKLVSFNNEWVILNYFTHYK